MSEKQQPEDQQDTERSDQELEAVAGGAFKVDADDRGPLGGTAGQQSQRKIARKVRGGGIPYPPADAPWKQGD